MTEAQRAAFRILCTTPQDRVRTHQAVLVADVDCRRGRRFGFPHPLTEQRLAWLRINRSLSREAQRAHLGVSATTLKNLMRTLRGRRLKNGRPRKEDA